MSNDFNGKTVKLIMVSGDKNANKYYNMFEQPDGTFKVEYGRVDLTTQHASYNMSQWETKYREKTRKGYKDVTEYTTIKESVEPKSDNTFISDDQQVRSLIEELQRWAKNTVSQNYRIKTKNVTQKMIDDAQYIIDKISKQYKANSTKKELNDLLVELFTVIPRKMGNVRDYLINDNTTTTEISKIIDNEQSILDTLSGQVSIDNDIDNETKSDEPTTKKSSLLDAMGIEVSYVTDKKVIDKVKKMMGDSANLFSRLFEVKNIKCDERYHKNEVKNEMLLWHGSRTQNFINILKTGLLIRPSGAIHTGSMFGDGIYTSNVCRKSIGYTSFSGSYWARGDDSKGFLALFAVNMGEAKIINRHSSDCYRFSEKTIAPYNSVWAKGGADLRNDEMIIYNPNRCSIRYLIEIKK